MLTNQMPEIPYTVTTGDLQRFEALAFSCLASYNSVARGERCITSFQRAFAVNEIGFVGRVVDGRPGYLVADWNHKPQPKVIVAIEGATSAGQIAEFWTNNLAATITGLTGRVFAKFAQHADAIYPLLTGNPTVQWALNTPGVPIIFTGFSLGAAIAEILAERFKLANPRKAMKVIKFASPRVGDLAWVNGRSRLVLRDSVYVGRDPIDLFPYFTGPLAGFSVLAPQFVSATWAISSEGTRMPLSADQAPSNTLHENSLVSVVQHALNFARTMDASNPWIEHSLWYYYLAFLFKEWGNRNHNMSARLWNLEFPDRNDFGGQFLGEPAPTDAMLALHDPPIDRSQYFRDDEIDAMNQALLNAGADPRDLDLRDTRVADGSGTGEVYGADEPVVPRVVDMIARPPQVFVHPASGRRRR